MSEIKLDAAAWDEEVSKAQEAIGRIVPGKAAQIHKTRLACFFQLTEVEERMSGAVKDYVDAAGANVQQMRKVSQKIVGEDRQTAGEFRQCG